MEEDSRLGLSLYGICYPDLPVPCHILLLRFRIVVEWDIPQIVFLGHVPHVHPPV